LTTNVLHFLKEKQIDKLITKIKNNTKINGLNIITTFTNKDVGYKEHPERHYFKKNELKKHYNDWKILEYNEFVTEPEKHGKDGKLHKHGVVVLIAKKI